jgi:hypothetical protein
MLSAAAARIQLSTMSPIRQIVELAAIIHSAKTTAVSVLCLLRTKNHHNAAVREIETVMPAAHAVSKL